MKFIKHNQYSFLETVDWFVNILPFFPSKVFWVADILYNNSFLLPKDDISSCSISPPVYISYFMVVCVSKQRDGQPGKQIETNTHSHWLSGTVPAGKQVQLIDLIHSCELVSRLSFCLKILFFHHRFVSSCLPLAVSRLIYLPSSLLTADCSGCAAVWMYLYMDLWCCCLGKYWLYVLVSLQANILSFRDEWEYASVRSHKHLWRYKLLQDSR